MNSMLSVQMSRIAKEDGLSTSMCRYPSQGSHVRGSSRGIRFAGTPAVRR